MAKLFFDIKESDQKRDREFAEVEKFNPYHGADGRFTTGSGATSFTYKPGASKAHDSAIAREKAKAPKGTAAPKSTSASNAGSKYSYTVGRKKEEKNWYINGKSTKEYTPIKDKTKKNKPEGDRAISNRKGGEIMDDIGTHKVSTSATISALKQAGFKRKDLKSIKRQYDLSDSQLKEISDNWNKYR